MNIDVCSINHCYIIASSRYISLNRKMCLTKEVDHIDVIRYSLTMNESSPSYKIKYKLITDKIFQTS